MSEHSWKVEKDFGTRTACRYDIICERCSLTAVSIDGYRPTSSSQIRTDRYDCNMRIVKKVLDE